MRRETWGASTIVASAPISAAAFGPLVDTVGARGTLLISGTLTIGLALLATALIRILRHRAELSSA